MRPVFCKRVSVAGCVMLVQASAKRAALTHVIVVGNEKGGTGKSTIAMHLAIALMKCGQRVATIDLDSRQKSLTHYVDNRRAWARRAPGMLKLPSQYHITLADGAQVAENETVEFERFEQVITTVQHRHDFVVIDTPPNSNFLVRLAHLAADTLVTPLHSSFVDIDVLGTVDPITF